MLLSASQCASPAPSAPEWAKVQRTLANASFVQRVLDYDVSQLGAAPALTAFVAAEYFGVGGKPALQSRKSAGSLSARASQAKVAEPLTYESVYRASRVAAALFSWAAAALLAAGIALPLDEAFFPEEPQASAVQGEPHVEEVNLEAAARLVAELEGPSDTAPSPEPPAPPAELEPAAARTPTAQAEIGPAQQAPEPAVSPEPLEAQPPDRHFEEVISFSFGESTLGEEQEVDLRRVAAAIRRRPLLQLQLVGCINEVEDDDVIRQRLQATKAFFVAQGIDCLARPDDGAMEVSRRWPSGVVCQLVLDKDKELQEYLTDRWCSEASARTQEDAAWLESVFHSCIH